MEEWNMLCGHFLYACGAKIGVQSPVPHPIFYRSLSEVEMKGKNRMRHAPNKSITVHVALERAFNRNIDIFCLFVGQNIEFDANFL